MNLFECYERIEKLETKRGLREELSKPARQIFALISGKQPIRITDIEKYWWFRDMSLSTIKRSVLELLNKGYIISIQNSEDRRGNDLYINDRKKEEV